MPGAMSRLHRQTREHSKRIIFPEQHDPRMQEVICACLQGIGLAQAQYYLAGLARRSTFVYR